MIMRNLIVLAAVSVLCACAMPTMPLSALPAKKPTFYGAATLAEKGTCEWQLAPDYTANALLRQRAARSLDAGAITVATATQILRLTDAARSALDQACAHDKAGEAQRAAASADSARVIRKEVERMLQGERK